MKYNVEISEEVVTLREVLVSIAMLAKKGVPYQHIIDEAEKGLDGEFTRKAQETKRVKNG